MHVFDLPERFLALGLSPPNAPDIGKPVFFVELSDDEHGGPVRLAHSPERFVEAAVRVLNREDPRIHNPPPPPGEQARYKRKRCAWQGATVAARHPVVP